MNRTMLTGRLTAEPELRYTPKGTAVCEANLAVDDGWGDNKKTLFIGITFWGTKAEAVTKYATKGQVLIIDGRLNQDVFKPQGSEREVRKTHVVCENFEFGERPRGSAPRSNQPTADPAPSPAPDTEADEIPF